MVPSEEPLISIRGCEKPAQRVGSLLGCGFREEMSALDGISADVVSPVALSVAVQIGSYDGKAARQQRRDAAPHQVRLRETMQQQDRRARSGSAHEYAGFTGLDFGG